MFFPGCGIYLFLLCSVFIAVALEVLLASYSVWGNGIKWRVPENTCNVSVSSLKHQDKFGELGLFNCHCIRTLQQKNVKKKMSYVQCCPNGKPRFLNNLRNIIVVISTIFILS